MRDCLRAMPRGTFTLPKLSACLGDGFPVGAVRVSLGIATNDEDLHRLERFLQAFSYDGASPEELASRA